MSFTQPPLHLDASDDDLVSRMATEQRRIAAALAPYDPTTATYAWFDTLRAIEEVINLPTIDWQSDPPENQLYGFPIRILATDPRPLVWAKQALGRRFSDTFANRFIQLMVQTAAVANALRLHGLHDLAGRFDTLGDAIGYFQSRRRHLVALLHLLPQACRGVKTVSPTEALVNFLPLVEMHGLQLMGAHQARLVQHARTGLDLPACTGPDLDMLDDLFLEPERSRIIEMEPTEAGLAMLRNREALEPDRLFSAAELRNDLVCIEAAYAEFNLGDTAFGPAAALIRALSTRFVERDFWVVISPTDLARLGDELSLPTALRSALVHGGATYFEAMSTYAPLVLVDGVYRSTVTLLSRFAYWWRAQTLDRIKRFQIRAGFMFEETVKAELEAQGFQCRNITRINHREFDVVTVRGSTIWNVQCKNNFTSLDRIDTDPGRFARYNKGLVRAYGRALTKERSREQLLKSHLNLDAIEHVVVSRFPVLTDDPMIVPFNHLSGFSRLADRIEKDGAEVVLPRSGGG